jgi:hypothetical protein
LTGCSNITYFSAKLFDFLPVQFVCLTQPINALAFVFDGINYGASDFGYAAYSMAS